MPSIEELKRKTDLPVVLADDQGCIRYMNGRFEAVFGWTQKEIIGRPLSTLIPSYLHDAHHLGFSRFLTTGKPTLMDQPLKLKAVSKDGREFEAEHVISAERVDGRWVFGATIRPLQQNA